MSVTMRDVAARAGVTPTVVSRVLHNKATAIRVSEATAERVRQAAKDMGYRVNVMARSLRERHTQMIGVLHGIGFARAQFDDGSRYFASLMDGIVNGAFEHGYSVTLCPKLLGQSPEDAMSDGRFDGLVWYSTFPSGENRRMLEQCSIPLVLIHTRASEFDNRFCSVVCDNDQGIGLGIDHLIGLGHRKVAFALDGRDEFGEVHERQAAFVGHLARHGIISSREDVINIGPNEAGLREYFARGCRHTAVVGPNEGVAGSFLRVAPDFGIRVPEDLSVVGFDSTAYCNEFRPRLTAISQPLVDMGRCALDLLIRNISGETLTSPQIVFPCGLDVRESTAYIAL